MNIESTIVIDEDRISIDLLSIIPRDILNIYLVIFITLIAALIASFAQLAFKKSLHAEIKGFRDLLRLAKNKGIIIGVIGYISSLGIYLYALKNAPLSFVYPTFGSSFIFIFLISVFLLKEKFNKKRAVGIFLVFVGIVIISLSMGL